MAQGSAILNAADAAINWPNPGGATRSLGGWFFMANRQAGTNQHFFYMNADSDIGLRMNDSDVLKISGFPEVASATPATGEWFYLAMVSEDGVGTTVYLYDDLLTQLCADFNASWDYGTAVDETTVGNGLPSGGTMGWPSAGLRVAQFRIWSAALSEAQIEAELASTTPVITSGLVASFENDPDADGWSVNGSVIVSTDYWPPNYASAPSKSMSYYYRTLGVT